MKRKYKIRISLLGLLVSLGFVVTAQDSVKHESNIQYVRELESAMKAVSKGKADVAFLLNPVRLDQMRDIVYEGNVMPQKSTDFYPKVLSGLVMYSLDQSGV